MSRSRYRIFQDFHPYFLTCTIVGWLPVFTRPEAVKIIYDSWRFLAAHERLTLYGYVIMENHLHIVASSPDLSEEMKNFKSFTARQIIDHLESKGERTLLDQLEYHKLRHKAQSQYQLWQEGSHPN